MTAGLGLEALTDLSGEVAVVTGGASGIGRAVVERLRAAGADIVIADLDPPAVVDDEGARAGSGRCHAVVADVGRPEAAEQVAAEAVRVFGRIDMAVNAAGIFPRAPALELDVDAWDRVVDVNLRGSFLVAQACARVMVADGVAGRIVNVASRQAVRPGPERAHYAASKAGVMAMSHTLALELAPAGIRVNVVAPGGVRTEGGLAGAVTEATRTGRTMAEEVQRTHARRIPLGRLGEPDDVALSVLYLLSGLSAWVTGTVLVVDGGALLL